MSSFLRNALVGREPLKRVATYGVIFCFIAGFISSFFNEAERSIRIPVFVIAGVCSLVWSFMLWRCSNNSNLGLGWLIRACIAFGTIGMLLLGVLM